MINLIIIIKDGKIHTSFQEKDITLYENSLLVRELEKIKDYLVNQDFQIDFRVEKEKTQ